MYLHQLSPILLFASMCVQQRQVLCTFFFLHAVSLSSSHAHIFLALYLHQYHRHHAPTTTLIFFPFSFVSHSCAVCLSLFMIVVALYSLSNESHKQQQQQHQTYKATQSQCYNICHCSGKKQHNKGTPAFEIKIKCKIIYINCSFFSPFFFISFTCDEIGGTKWCHICRLSHVLLSQGNNMMGCRADQNMPNLAAGQKMTNFVSHSALHGDR